MITLLSPAKTLDYDSTIADVEGTIPSFVDESERLVKKLRTLSKKKVSNMMSLNKDLTELNVMRYQEWQPDFTTDESRPAILTFNGEVYRGLGAADFSQSELDFSQDHLRILSGLHGLLKPLDRIRPYRLEMGVKLPVGRKKNLYDFWTSKITEALNEALEAHDSKVIVNLASNEYSKAIDFKNIKGEVITPIFKDFKNGEYKVVMTWAKHARGQMARYIMKNRITSPEDLKGFNEYTFDPNQSKGEEWVFVRDSA